MTWRKKAARERGKGKGASDVSVIAPVDLREALEERYLRYALSTITGRALPDARDGLKPVHRRILYGMHILRLDPGAPFKKCAKIVGDVMGSFHPHGDQAIYDALVRLAQDFSSRYPLVDGQGNFGNVDGDSAAAYRYTEARMTAVARSLLEGIDEDAIDFIPNYSGEEKEPVVLPSALPNLLANGAQGIAVGMATSIPPHNLAELCDAALYLISHRKATAEQLLTFVQGPDFPTGGIIVDKRDEIIETYRTGRGSFRVRARWMKEELPRGGWVVVVTEIPYGVQKSRLIERLAELISERKLPLVADVRDESAEDVRIVFEPRARTVDPALMMETLFKLSELETRFPMNMNVLVDGVTPRVVSLDEALRQWLDHRRTVLQRRSRHRLAAIVRRIEQLEGMVIVFLNLDEVIRIIREEDDAKGELKKAFKLTDLQVEYILDTRLRALRRLEEMELKKELGELSAERKEIEALLADEDKQWKTIAWQVRELKKTYGPQTPKGKRRTTFRGRARGDRSRPRRGDDRARAGDHRRLEEGLDSRAQGSCAGSLDAAVQGRRRTRRLLLRADDVENPGARVERQGLYARRVETSRRARTWRADPALRRDRGRRRCRRRSAACRGRRAAARDE